MDGLGMTQDGDRFGRGVSAGDLQTIILTRSSGSRPRSVPMYFPSRRTEMRLVSRSARHAVRDEDVFMARSPARGETGLGQRSRGLVHEFLGS